MKTQKLNTCQRIKNVYHAFTNLHTKFEQKKLILSWVMALFVNLLSRGHWRFNRFLFSIAAKQFGNYNNWKNKKLNQVSCNKYTDFHKNLNIILWVMALWKYMHLGLKSCFFIITFQKTTIEYFSKNKKCLLCVFTSVY